MNQNFPQNQYNLNQNNNFPSQSPYMLNLNANPFMASKPPKKNVSQIPNTTIPHHQQSNRIREVYVDNFIQEIKIISNYLSKYPYVGMDTEFPGILYPCSGD